MVSNEICTKISTDALEFILGGQRRVLILVYIHIYEIIHNLNKKRRYFLLLQ